MKTYINGWYIKNNPYSKPEIEEDPNKIIYKGFELHRYISGSYNVVKNGVCIGMYAGLNGARKFVDNCKLFRFRFSARKLNAIGIYQDFTESVYSDSEEHAERLLYHKYDNISFNQTAKERNRYFKHV